MDAVPTASGCAESVAAPTSAEPPLVSRMKGAFFGAVVADALSLGTHYEYDAKRIRSFYGRIDRYYAPGEKTGGETHGIGWGARNYHDGNGVGPAKRAGETTDYGDYNVLMLRHLAATASKPHRVELKELIPNWQKAMTTWRSWRCTMTKEALQQVAHGVPFEQLGGMSNAMSFRSAAAYGYFDKEEDVAHAARTMMFTHKETTALDAGEFFARVAFRIIHQGLTPEAAVKQVAEQSSAFIKQKVKQAFEKVQEATDPSKDLSKEEFADDLALTSMARLWDVGKTEPIKVGKASPTEGVLPGSLYLILKYNDFQQATQANAEIGGDSASRSVVIGMVLGAYQGMEGLPAGLLKDLVDREEMERMLNNLPLIKASSS